MTVELNVWGTDKSLINEDEFCPDCEREVPGHYYNCPRYQGAWSKVIDA